MRKVFLFVDDSAEAKKVRAAISLRAFCEIVLERLDDDHVTPEDFRVMVGVEDLCDVLDVYIEAGAKRLSDRNGAR
jgi:hypothetical protein